MRKIVEYEVLIMDSVSSLETTVNARIKEGWQPQGGVSETAGGEWQMQAMVKYEEVE